MYEYPDLNSINDMDRELFKALKHDPLLRQCYSAYEINHNPKPFDYKKFYVYLSYMALKMNQRHMKALISNAERFINPAIVLQLGKDIYSKKIIDRLISNDKKSYWQKLWDAIWRR